MVKLYLSTLYKLSSGGKMIECSTMIDKHTNHSYLITSCGFYGTRINLEECKIYRGVDHYERAIHDAIMRWNAKRYTRDYTSILPPIDETTISTIVDINDPSNRTEKMELQFMLNEYNGDGDWLLHKIPAN